MSCSVIQEIPLTSAIEFLDFFRKSNDVWWESDSFRKICPWIFRGQWDSEWSLQPSIFRACKWNPLLEKIHEIDRVLHQNNEVEFYDNSFREFFEAECELIGQFSDLARDVRLNLATGFVRPSLQSRPELFRKPNFGREDSYFDYYCPDLRLLPLAQHHGLPTRLLDFTRNPLNAILFGITGAFQPQAASKLAVWAFKTQSWFHQQFLRNILVLDQSEYEVDEFVLSQEGCFVHFKHAFEWLTKHRRWPSLEDILLREVAELEGKMDSSEGSRYRLIRGREPDCFPLIKKITLPHTEAQLLRVMLEREGISIAHLMPTLEHVASTVLGRWRIPVTGDSLSDGNQS